MTSDDVRRILAVECEKVGGLREWARRHKINPGYICHVLAARKEPHDAICTALGLKRVISYEFKSAGAIRKR